MHTVWLSKRFWSQKSPSVQLIAVSTISDVQKDSESMHVILKPTLHVSFILIVLIVWSCLFKNPQNRIIMNICRKIMPKLSLVVHYYLYTFYRLLYVTLRLFAMG